MREISNAKQAARPLNFTLAIATLIFGYSARKYGAFLPEFVAAYAPDALWALLVFFLIAVAKPRWPAPKIGGIALIFAYGIELSQLYQAPWLNAIRATKIGALILGHGFLWSDLICYAVGIGFGVWLESLILQQEKSS